MEPYTRHFWKSDGWEAEATNVVGKRDPVNQYVCVRVYGNIGIETIEKSDGTIYEKHVEYPYYSCVFKPVNLSVYLYSAFDFSSLIEYKPDGVC